MEKHDTQEKPSAQDTQEKLSALDTQEKPSALQLVKDFGDNTSMHGAGGAINSKSLWKRVIWTVLVLCGTGAAVFQLGNVLQDFYTNPVITIVNLKHESRMLFPAITICNMNSMKKSATPNKTIEDILNAQLKVDMTDYQAEVNAAIRALDWQERYDARHKFEDMYISCQYDMKECPDEIPYYNYFAAGLSGICYTLKTVNYTDTPRPGPQNGLILEWAIEYSEYISLASQAGVKVIVHEQDKAPFPEDGGILAPPGVSTSIAIKKTVTHRLPAPYSDCITDTDGRSSFRSLYDDHGFSYTETACKKSCYQLSLVRECHCCDTDLPCNETRILEILKGKLGEIKKLFYCDTSYGDDTDAVCFSRIDTRFLNGDLDCMKDCAPACSQTTFDMVVSTALWPSDPYLDVLWNKVNATVPESRQLNPTDDNKKEFISKNILRLEIFYEKIDFLEITTSPMYSWSNMLGNIGGLLGLWLGFSILTGFEIINLCVDVVTVCALKIRRKGMTTTYEIRSLHL